MYKGYKQTVEGGWGGKIGLKLRKVHVPSKQNKEN